MSKQNGTLRGTGWIMIKFQGFQTYVAEFSVILVLKSEDRYLRILKHPTKSEENLIRKFSVNFLTSTTTKTVKKRQVSILLTTESKHH